MTQPVIAPHPIETDEPALVCELCARSTDELYRCGGRWVCAVCSCGCGGDNDDA